VGEEPGRLSQEADSPQGTVDSPQGTVESGVKEEGAKASEDHGANPAQEVAALASEIEQTREKLGGYVSELDRRRHEVLSRTPARAGVVAAVGALIGLGTFLIVRRRRRRKSLAGKKERFAEALAAFSGSRRTAFEEMSPGRKILLAAASAAAAQVARRLSARALSSKKR